MDLEKEALEQVAALLQRPDQLEKLPELKKRADRKKTAVEAMLRTGVQSQMEGIRSAIAHLHTAQDDISTVSKSVQSIKSKLEIFPALKEELRELRDANARHGQYVAAKENLEHIFNINTTLADCREALENGKLLIAHKYIMDMERARDDLLAEVHKMNTGNTEYEKNLLINFFKGINEVVLELARNMWFIMGRCLEMVKGNESGGGPQQVVTCLRIVEREERIDAYYEDQLSVNPKAFSPPGRPRKWRKKCLEVIEKTVTSRVEGNQLEDRSLHKAWLARYLEVTRHVIVDDLALAKAAIPCFPPDYQIYDRLVHMYHNAVCRKVREIANDQLEKAELVQLMSWIQSYGSDQLLGNVKLKINSVELLQDVPVLPRATFYQLCDTFVDMTQVDMQKWLDKTVIAEKDDWYKNVRPDEDNNGYLYTSFPNILFGMLRDTVTLAKEVSIDVIPAVINLTINEFHELAAKYKDAFTAYKTKYFEDRSKLTGFTSTMIAIANNLHTCIESTEKYIQQVRLSMEGTEENTSGPSGTLPRGRRKPVTQAEIIESMKNLNNRWNNGASIAVNYLREEVVVDIGPHLTELFSRKWLVGSAALETICMTISDYHRDHKHLKPVTRCVLIMDVQLTVVAEYLKGIEQRRLTFQTYEERLEAGKKLKDEANRLDVIFTQMLEECGMGEQFAHLTSILPALADVISLRDKSLLSLETTGYARKYPNTPPELLTALLSTREDVGRSEAKALVDDAIESTKYHPRDDAFDQLFSMRQSENNEWLPTFGVSDVLNSFMKRK